MKTFRDYELPPLGRTPESFAYRIDSVWVDMVVDTLYTDEESEVERIMPLVLEELYDVRVTHDGITVETKARIGDG